MNEMGRIAPQCAADVVSARLGPGVVVFEPAHRRLHSLNASAAMVWKRLDGTKTVSEIAQSLVPKFAGDDDTIFGDVAAVVDRFGDLGLLANGHAIGASTAQAAEDVSEKSPELRTVDPNAEANTEKLNQMSWPHTHGLFDVSGQRMVVRSQEPEAAVAVVRQLVDVEETDGDPVRYISIRHRFHDGEEQWRIYFDGYALGTFESVDDVAQSLAHHVASMVPTNADRRSGLAANAADEPMAPRSPDALLLQGSAVEAGSGCVIVLANSEQPEELSPALAGRGFTPMYRPTTPIGLAHAQVLMPRFANSDAAPDDDQSSRPISAMVIAQPIDGASTGLERVGEVDGLRLLLDRAHQLQAYGSAGFLALVTVASQTPIYRLTYGSLDAAVEVVIDVSGLRPA